MDKKEYERAFSLARSFHSNQVDKGGRPYMEHLVAVVNGVDTYQEKTVAILHDILEDTILEPGDLIKLGFEKSVVVAIVCLSKVEDESYEDYLKRVKSNTLAKAVKESDLLHNMKLERLPEITKKDIKRTKKYLDALWYLIQE